MNFKILKQIGVNEKEIMSRFMNNEEFYGRVLQKFLEDKSYPDLKDSLDKQDYDAAFRAAHTLKGVSANLGLGNITELAADITEQLRPGKRRSNEVVGHKMLELDDEYIEAMNVIDSL